MAANKKKKGVKVRDLKPSKDARGGAGAVRSAPARNLNLNKTQIHGSTGKTN